MIIYIIIAINIAIKIATKLRDRTGKCIHLYENIIKH